VDISAVAPRDPREELGKRICLTKGVRRWYCFVNCSATCFVDFA
jgi:hypothetical protein